MKCHIIAERKRATMPHESEICPICGKHNWQVLLGVREGGTYLERVVNTDCRSRQADSGEGALLWTSFTGSGAILP
jgi:hypothetical protein